jgi:hypothetical protein
MEALKRSLALDNGKASGETETARGRKPPRKVAPAPARKAKASKG